MTPSSLLALLRKHAAFVAAKRPGRDVKMFDDELRAAVIHYCTPCGAWIDDRATIDSMYPLDRLDDATSATCLGLYLRDSTIAWGDARPRGCRR